MGKHEINIHIQFLHYLFILKDTFRLSKSNEPQIEKTINVHLNSEYVHKITEDKISNKKTLCFGFFFALYEEFA